MNYPDMLMWTIWWSIFVNRSVSGACFKDNATLTAAIAKLKGDAHLSKRDSSLDIMFQTAQLTSCFATWPHALTTNQMHVKKCVNLLPIQQSIADFECHCYRTVTCRKVCMYYNSYASCLILSSTKCFAPFPFKSRPTNGLQVSCIVLYLPSANLICA